MQQNIHKVYFLREIATQKIVYAGITKDPLNVRFNGHVQEKKFKRYEYTIELVQQDLTREQAAQLERLLIKQYNLIEDGWNKSPGSINGYSNNHSEQQKEKWRQERPGKKVSPEHAEKNKTARLGKINSPEHAKAVIESRQKPVMCLETGIEYRSARHAAKDLNLQYSKISLVCNGKRTTTGGLHFVFINKK
jgi:GIY-YIG catalytic domain